MVMRDEVFSTVGAQDKDACGYQVSDLEDIKFHLADPVLNMYAVFRPRVDTLFSSSTFDEFEMGSMAENPIQINGEQDRENSPHTIPATTDSERPTQPPVLMKSRPKS